ncbi:hypothetical protein M409DRAFT_58607 [Zasmidium cellare ATCC 36951]|uniref:Uncharacterized protein n=1 Tax=Zasmidium cellare ATCC 36951 TaxID=1080233 RepID=A0A6A6C7I8_ZASCE|nr:uncharacterized protein M409DRAFT_58607 [Zasmidium cellare ATCC 36951]KAF2162170.1 hypothetical protein M409DRAFT_58607 [Zasmidium cellare ATCC 36951]
MQHVPATPAPSHRRNGHVRQAWATLLTHAHARRGRIAAEGTVAAGPEEEGPAKRPRASCSPLKFHSEAEQDTEGSGWEEGGKPVSIRHHQRRPDAGAVPVISGADAGARARASSAGQHGRSTGGIWWESCGSVVAGGSGCGCRVGVVVKVAAADDHYPGRGASNAAAMPHWAGARPILGGLIIRGHWSQRERAKNGTSPSRRRIMACMPAPLAAGLGAVGVVCRVSTAAAV